MLRDDLAVAMLADHHRDPLAAMVPEQRKQLAVPEREDDALAVARARAHRSLVRARACATSSRAARITAVPGAHDPADLAARSRAARAPRRVHRRRERGRPCARRAPPRPASPSDSRTRRSSSIIAVRARARRIEQLAEHVGDARRAPARPARTPGATSRPATTFTSPMYGMRTSRRAAAYVMALVRYATTSGQPATAASSVVVPLLHIAASAARSTVNDAECTSGNGQRSGGIVTCGAALTTTLSDGSRRCSSRAVSTNGSRWRAISWRAAPREQREQPIVRSRRRALRAPRRDRAASARGRAADARRTSRRCRAARSSASSNGRMTAAFVIVRASSGRRFAPHAHTCGVM